MAKSYALGLPPEQRVAKNSGAFATSLAVLKRPGRAIVSRLAFGLARCGRFGAAEVLPSSVDMTLVCKVT